MSSTRKNGALQNRRPNRHTVHDAEWEKLNALLCYHRGRKRKVPRGSPATGQEVQRVLTLCYHRSQRISGNVEKKQTKTKNKNKKNTTKTKNKKDVSIY